MLYNDHLPTTTDDEKECIEDITGCIPLLLCALFEYSGQAFKDIKFKFLESPELKKVSIQVNKHALQMKEILSIDDWQL